MNAIARTNKAIELKKHVNAIHCTNNLSLVQRKVFNALLFNAYPELPHKSTFQIPARQLCQLIGYNSNDYAKLKAALLGLITIAIEWNVIDAKSGQEKKWKASSILAAAELEAGVCSYEYSQLMKELLYQPEIYGRINIEVVAKFKSSYGLALYENCVRYQGLPQTPWFTIEVFRKLMGVFDDKYHVFKDFKKRVLNIAINEVNNNSSLQITLEVERKNQKVTRLRFKLDKRAHLSRTSTKSTINQEIDETLVNTFGLSKTYIKELYQQYEPEYIQEKVGLILQSEPYLSGSIRDLAGYFVQALRKDYKACISSKKVIAAARKEAKEKEKAIEKKQKEMKERYHNYVAKKIGDALQNLTEKQRKQLEDEFVVNLKEQNNFIYKWYKKHALEHPATKSCFNDFFRNSNLCKLEQLLSYDDFMAIVDEYN